ncbi:MAG: TrkH family potassium uptake protein [Nitritalea sp.]
MIHGKAIARVMGILMLLVGLLMLPGAAFSYYYGSSDLLALLGSSAISILSGLAFFLAFKEDKDGIRKREGYLIVALTWVVMAIFGMMPYLISGAIPKVPDALFETISGLTTTGATILTDIEALPQGLLFWRSMTQWIGGLGIIVLTVAIFPLLGIGGIELFVAEASGPTNDKLHPRIRETARRLWLLYVGLTVVVAALYYIFGMNLFDAVNHALTTTATGGFSTKNNSFAFFTSPALQYIAIVFMFICGINFTVIYFFLTGRVKAALRSDEFKAYTVVVFVLIIALSIPIYFLGDGSVEESFRKTAFQIISMITTTGFVVDDYTAYHQGITLIFFMFLFFGASAGSTSGGIKFVRHLTFFKNSYLEFKRIIHPRAIVPLKINGDRVTGKIITSIMNFLLIYLMVFVFGSIFLSFMGYDIITSFGAVATSLGNVGPAIGGVGPEDSWNFFNPVAKVFLAFLMLLGRLELFTILVLFTPYFWKAN